MTLWPSWYQPPRGRKVAGDDIIRRVAQFYGITPDDMRSHRRQAEYVRARAVTAMILKERGNTYPMIARMLKRDHTTIIHLCQSFPQRLRDPATAAIYDELRMTAVAA